MRYIIGIGNYSMYDDSVGIRVIEYIEENRLYEGMNFKAIDLSGNVLNLISYLETANKIVIIDTFKEGIPPGELRLFNINELKTKKIISGITSHEGDVLKIIELARRTGVKIPEIKVLGIGPAEIKESFGISDLLQSKISEYANASINEINF